MSQQPDNTSTAQPGDIPSAAAPTASSQEEDQTNRDTRRAKGEFVRGVSSAREVIAPGGTYPPEAGRYHLIVAFNCPWCHRVALARALLGLQDAVSMDVLMPVRTEEGHPQGEGKWQFLPEGLTARNGDFVKFDECTTDSISGMSTVVEIYQMCNLDQRSVPILFDKQTKTIVNNESSEIVRMFETAMLSVGTNSGLELYPEALQTGIDEWNDLVYPKINNGAYKAGFSSNQEVYKAAYEGYFEALETLDAALETTRFLCGEDPTEADLRLFPTLFRHDPVYHNRMKLNHKFISDYPNLWRWLCDFYALPGVAEASPLEHMKQGYFGRTGNGTVPLANGADYIARLADRNFGARQVLARNLADQAGGGASAGDLLALAQQLAALHK